jgi:DNA polymerase-3 subunit gamma/tau
MSYIPLYQKYRPKKFADVIGQENIVKILLNSIKNDKIVNAYIFTGSKGTGKTSIAKIFAKAINCLNPNNGDACNECANCKLINENKAVDILELDAASNNGVDEMRKITSACSTGAFDLKKKVFIIDEAHMLTTAAWNALLKTVEETPKHIVFIFATTEFNKIPDTIKSRCQQHFFNKLNALELEKVIKNVVNNEHINIDMESIKMISELADGAARDALTITDQLNLYTNSNIDINSINKIFGLLNKNTIVEFINKIKYKDIAFIKEQTEKFSISGVDFILLSKEIVNLLINKMVFIQTQNEKIVSYTTKILNDIILDFNECLVFIDKMQNTLYKMKNNSESLFMFNLAIFEIMNELNNINVVNLIPTEKKIVINTPPSQPIVSKPVENIKPIVEKQIVTNNIEQKIKKSFKDCYSTKTIFAYKPNEKINPIAADVLNSEPVANTKIENKIVETITTPSVAVNTTSPIITFPNIIDTLLCDVYFNKDEEMKNYFNKKLNELQNSPSNLLNFFKEVNNIEFASKNGAIILFNTEEDAKIFNMRFFKSQNKEFI